MPPELPTPISAAQARRLGGGGLAPADPLAHRALEALLHAEASLRRRLAADLRQEQLSPIAFSLLVVLMTAGGELQLRTLRRRLQMSKPNASELLARLQARGLLERRAVAEDRRATCVALTAEGSSLVQRIFPEYSGCVRSAFAALDEGEKRSLAQICRKLAA